MGLAFDSQPTLQGTLLELRPLRSDDFDALYAVAGDPELWKQHPKWNRYQREVFEVFFLKLLETSGALLVLDRASGEVIGNSAYYKLEPDSVFIGYTFLKRACWGGRFNRELKRLMLDHAFKFVSRVYFEAGENNVRSRRAMEKIGAIFVRSELLDGAPNVVYEITPAQLKV